VTPRVLWNSFARCGTHRCAAGPPGTAGAAGAAGAADAACAAPLTALPPAAVRQTQMSAAVPASYNSQAHMHHRPPITTKLGSCLNSLLAPGEGFFCLPMPPSLTSAAVWSLPQRAAELLSQAAGGDTSSLDVEAVQRYLDGVSWLGPVPPIVPAQHLPTITYPTVASAQLCASARPRLAPLAVLVCKHHRPSAYLAMPYASAMQCNAMQCNAGPLSQRRHQPSALPRMHPAANG
jgi:hypothetical protein